MVEHYEACKNVELMFTNNSKKYWSNPGNSREPTKNQNWNNIREIVSTHLVSIRLELITYPSTTNTTTEKRVCVIFLLLCHCFNKHNLLTEKGSTVQLLQYHKMSWGNHHCGHRKQLLALRYPSTCAAKYPQKPRGSHHHTFTSFRFSSHSLNMDLKC